MPFGSAPGSRETLASNTTYEIDLPLLPPTEHVDSSRMFNKDIVERLDKFRRGDLFPVASVSQSS